MNHVSDLFEKYNFGEADRYLYDFIWNDFCDWYIEMSKEALNSDDEKLKKGTDYSWDVAGEPGAAYRFVVTNAYNAQFQKLTLIYE